MFLLFITYSDTAVNFTLYSVYHWEKVCYYNLEDGFLLFLIFYLCNDVDLLSYLSLRNLLTFEQFLMVKKTLGHFLYFLVHMQ